MHEILNEIGRDGWFADYDRRAGFFGSKAIYRLQGLIKRIAEQQIAH